MTDAIGILKYAGAVIIVTLTAQIVLAPIFQTFGVTFQTSTSVLVTFVGLSLAFLLMIGMGEYFANDTKPTTAKIILGGVLVLAIFLTVKYGSKFVGALSPAAASVYPLG